MSLLLALQEGGVNVVAPAAQATATGPAPSLLVQVGVPVAGATAEGSPPTPLVTVVPPVAAANGAAPDPAPMVTPSAPAAEASASSPPSTPMVAINAPAAGASATGPAPTISTGAAEAAPTGGEIFALLASQAVDIHVSPAVAIAVFCPPEIELPEPPDPYPLLQMLEPV